MIEQFIFGSIWYETHDINHSWQCLISILAIRFLLVVCGTLFHSWTSIALSPKDGLGWACRVETVTTELLNNSGWACRAETASTEFLDRLPALVELKLLALSSWRVLPGPDELKLLAPSSWTVLAGLAELKLLEPSS